MLPVNVISPLLTVAVTVGKSLVASVTPWLMASSVLIVTGGGGGATVVLFTTDFTPLISLAVVSASVAEEGSFTSPLNVATPSVTLAETPDNSGVAENFSVMFACISASLGAQLY